MHALFRLGLWLGLALAGFTGCANENGSTTTPTSPAHGAGDARRIIDPPPVVPLPFDSPVANAHHRWMRENWALIRQSADSRLSLSARPFRLDDPNDWLDLSPQILDLVCALEQGHVPAGYDTALDAARDMAAWMAEGIDEVEMHRRLSAHPVALKHPEHFEILMSTWLVARENGQDLGGTLGEYGILIDMIGTGIAGPAGGAAASAGYLIGRLIREYW